MAIVSASIEPIGWVLSVVFTGGAGGFADYVMDPDGSPRVLLRSSHAGFVQSGGEAVAGTLAREIPATIPLRLPVNPSAPSPAVIDEVDLGGGQRRVRLALSNFIYATDTGLTLDVLASWRTGEGAATGIPVTNNSTVAAPIPIMRWADYQLQVVAGVFRLSLIVASHHPVGFRPVAGVKFTVTDGTTVKEFWALDLATDNTYGDNLRCYSVEVDPATATALTAGQLRCDAEVYPWLGAMRSTDPAGTRAMGALQVAARTAAAETPFVVGYDPTGDRYRSQWVVLDPVNGTTTAAAAMVQTTLAAAKAVAPASKPATLMVALQALYLANRTLAAANGGSSASRAADGARIVLPPGVDNIVGGTSVTSGLTSSEMPIRIIGDPDEADPRATCRIQSNNNTSNPPETRAGIFAFENCEIRFGQSRFMSGPFFTSFRNCEVVGKAGFETSSSMLTAAAAPAGRYTMSAVQTRWWLNGQGMDTAQHRFGLIRACEHSRGASATTYLKNRWINEDDPVVGPAPAFTTFNINSDLAGCEDIFIAYNDLRRARTRMVNFTLPPAAVAGTTYPSQRRHVMLGNVFELINPTGTQPFFSVGESAAVTASYNIIDNNTFIGERVNIWYNDPTSCATDVNSELFCNRMANNAFDRNATKHDDFNDPVCGWRPHLIGGWSAQCGVQHEGNWDGGRASSNIGSFRYYFRGLRSVQTNVETAPGVVDDRSRFGTNTGNGNYAPQPSSPLRFRALNGSTDVDFNGQLLLAPAAAGAVQSPTIDIVVPDGRLRLDGGPVDVSAQAGAVLINVPQGRLFLAGEPPEVQAAAFVQAGAGRMRVLGGAATITVGVLPPVPDPDVLMPLSLAEAKAWLKIDVDDEDALLTGLIRAAAAVLADDYYIICGNRQFVLMFEQFGEGLRLLPTPLTSVDEVRYLAQDGEDLVLDASAWRVRPVRGIPTLLPAYATNWPAGGEVRVTITAGYASRQDIPDEIRVAAKMMIAHWYEVRTPVNIGSSVNDIPLTVDALLAPWRVRAISL